MPLRSGDRDQAWAASFGPVLNVSLHCAYNSPKIISNRNTRRHGVLVVTHHRDRRRQGTHETKKIEFSEFIQWLPGIAATIKHNASGHITVECVGLNAWKSSSASTEPKQVQQKPKTSVKRPSKVKAAAKN